MIFVDKNLGARMNKIIEDKVCTDVYFVINDGETKISAHKLFLVASSPVFREMFDSPTLQTSEVIIDDPNIDEVNFEVFIKNLSTGEVKINSKNVSKQAYLANKYKTRSVKDFCALFLCQRIKHLNVFEVLELVSVYLPRTESMQPFQSKSSDFCKFITRNFWWKKILD